MSQNLRARNFRRVSAEVKTEKMKEVAQSCLTLCDPMDCSLPGSSIHGIFLARVLEWVAIAVSRYMQYIAIKE